MVTNTEHIPSKRTANQREVVKNRNQASAGAHKHFNKVNS